MDRQRALSVFQEYVSAYNLANPRIALKVDHSLRVAQLCERIALCEGCTDANADLAWLLGLLHDIGRFEQVRRYDTFNDAVTVGHAALGAEVLFDECVGETPLIRKFLQDSSYDALVRKVVETHSDYRLPESLDEDTRFFCNVLRDADKIDIVKVNCVCAVEDIYGVVEADMTKSALSPECVQLFYQHRCLPRDVRSHPADVMLGHICFAWELVFDESRRIMLEQGYLRQMLGRQWRDPATQDAFRAMEAYMLEELVGAIPKGEFRGKCQSPFACPELAEHVAFSASSKHERSAAAGAFGGKAACTR